MNIADIKVEFGAYYLKEGQNLARIYEQLRHKTGTEELFTPILTDETIWRATEARHSRVLQPFQKVWTPIGATEFKPVEIQQFQMKADVQEYPDDLEATWLGFLTDSKNDRKTWPFVRWWLETQVIPQLKEDFEMNEIWKGVYVAPTANTPGAISTSMNGMRKTITDLITAGRIVPIVLGAPDTDAAVWVEQVEQFADSINQKYWGIKMDLVMQPSLERRFQRGYREKYGQNANYKESNGTVDFTNLNIVGKSSMIGSNRIWCSPKQNLIRMGKKTANMNNFQIESIDRLVKMFTDFWSGVGVVIPEAVFVNDQA